jgi:hypothetical protein
MNVFALIKCGFGARSLVNKLSNVSRYLLECLQMVHDDSGNWANDKKGLLQSLVSIANENELKMPKKLADRVAKLEAQEFYARSE